jgi:DNA-directed RNA polymerase
MKFPGTEWKLPDGFKARNYYIKPVIDSETSAGSPTHRQSVYSSLLPDWYSKGPGSKSALRISNRIKDHWKDHPEILDNVEFSKAMKSKNNLSKGQMVRILHLIDPEKKDEDANQIRPLLHHAKYSFKRYDIDRKNREKLKKSAIAPNFVHSLDAYHMRTSVRELSESIDQISFWAVHDAFGTHPCDVPEMRRVVKEEFLKMYEDKNFRYWLDEMVAYQDHRGKRKLRIDFDKDILEFDTEFKNLDQGDINGKTGLITLCKEAGLDSSGNQKKRILRLKAHKAAQEGKTVQEKYPDKKLKDIWDESASDLDISKVADSEYMIS